MTTRSRLLVLVAAMALLAMSSISCPADEASGPVSVCDPLLDSLDPAQGPTAGGTDVVLRGLFLVTELPERDIAIRVGGVDAELIDTARTGCTSCDACTLPALRCFECERVCRGETGWLDDATGEWREAEVCAEQVSFRTPPGALGSTTLSVRNGRGAAEGLAFLYTDSAGDGDDDSSGDDSSGDDDSGDDDSGR